MDSAKNGRWIIPFKKFGMVRVKCYFVCIKTQVFLIMTVEIYMLYFVYCRDDIS